MLKINTDFDLLRVEIIDQNGRIVLSSSEKEINVSQLLTGVYFVKCFGVNNKIYFSKFIKM
ncbi:MAG: T9SS type A sorting domain-containing protein [Saprospiraceae bacterium]|nr:T9SS type A sorting domain-containing protein [Saprospiraceae bacterium]